MPEHRLNYHPISASVLTINALDRLTVQETVPPFKRRPSIQEPDDRPFKRPSLHSNNRPTIQLTVRPFKKTSDLPTVQATVRPFKRPFQRAYDQLTGCQIGHLPNERPKYHPIDRPIYPSTQRPRHDHSADQQTERPTQTRNDFFESRTFAPDTSVLS